MIEWEEFDGNRSHVRFKRCRVVDGWMVWSDYGPGKPGKMTFFEDPSHAWEGDLIDLA